MPTNPTKRHVLSKWTLIFAGWTFLAFLFSGPQMIQAIRLNRAAEGWTSVVGELIFSYLWFALTPLVIWLSKSFRIEGGQRFKRISIHFLASVIFLLMHILLFTVISTPFGWYSHLTPYWNRYFLLILNFTPSNVMFYWGIVVIEHALDYYQKLQERELRASQLEAQLAQSQLQVLKMQLHPHFLFNTLNAISALIRESPDEADEMVSRLGDLLRMTLETAGLQEVSFKKELEFLKHYLDIEQTRFQDRLKVEMAIEPETLDGLVPSMILQPLVENSVRHGIAPRPEGGSIKIKAWRDNGLLLLEVEDDGPGLCGDTPLKERVGLSNTRARVKNLYGDEHDLKLRNGADGGLVVSLSIPFRTDSGSSKAYA
ncbi:MAG TPA: histidine kinase [Pyrinomonadaceae bacterium]|nr:histidine kinase [Pyrinomonadaceae bacterium]